MIITDIQATTLKGFKQWNYVRVLTDDGLIGLGEAHPGRGVVEFALRQLKPLLVGEDPRNIEPLYTRMLRPAGNRAGVALAAIAGVESALWDLRGKELGVPICDLLGGMYRERIRLYADVGHGKDKTDTPESWAARAREGVGDGYQAIKFDIDNSANELSQDAVNRELSTAEIEKMTALVAAAREAIGPGVDLCIDCHALYSVHSAIRLAKRFEAFNLMFLEDPVSNDNVEAMAKVTSSTSIPICTGEFIYRRDGFRELIQRQACDMLHVDVSATGGILEAKKIADLADLYTIPFAAHNITSPIGMTATAHVCAAVRNFFIMELPYHEHQTPWRWQLATAPEPLIQDNVFVVPRRPGLGVELNEEVARAHVAPGYGYFGETK
ncbi:MAG: mandelate racemase/muconate lactonizing enzyme family protein [Candidatus Sumerlaeota bacterium]|nr:mandelate racemase/muconate lactonizing enzyme family protein [Candidatus Sumerlaeota bacterium]